ncbi:hypothetical protein CYLTODRAFT_485498 [Cylindrobasidium torrendii FP15055 ss-10]|uniref:MYND-type domain-containing protein n=1 Tax=Cylindrobasidium torrendii FP15055 ss-10 TaxID=1314674 RepID=A0A0D7BSV8_9AGAR|nr:hypothetical protein CYLTODRAFT_485498 [Cylindrobasidium torrendii FP15055 ss-10]
MASFSADFLEKMKDVETILEGSDEEAIKAFNSMQVVISGFVFCKDHGSEFCNYCYTDHRKLNNEVITGRIPNYFKVFCPLEDPDGRTPVSSVFGTYNPIPTGRIHPTRWYEFYACSVHQRDDCPDCFNWVDIVKNVQKQKKQVRKVHDRKQVLGLLHSMGATFAATTKLKDDFLEKRLTMAVQSAQCLPSQINPIELPKWPSLKKAVECVSRQSMAEALNLSNPKTSPGAEAYPLFHDTLMDVRQTIFALVRQFGEGYASCIIQDSESTQAICVRVIEIFKLKDETPIVTLVYQTGSSSEPVDNTREFVQNLVDQNIKAVPTIKADIQEQALLRKILADNASRLAAAYKPKKEKSEKAFVVSFIAPILPLSQVDIGRIMHNTGCVLCGEKGANRCAQCHSTSYCSRECQKAHWKEHKAMCKSLKGGKWLPLRITTRFEVDGQQLHVATFSTHSPIPMGTNATALPENDGVPPDVHGPDQPFIVKLQKPLTPTEYPSNTPSMLKGDNSLFNTAFAPIMIYDRQRSFKVYATAPENPGNHGQFINEIRSSASRMKVYRWAKRVGPHELSVCLDREPSPLPTW